MFKIWQFYPLRLISVTLTRKYAVWYLGRPGNWRVVRGGSWNNDQINARAAYRNHNHPDNRNNNLGARVVRRSTSYAVPFLQVSGRRARTGGCCFHAAALPVNARWLRLAGCGQERQEMAQVGPVWHNSPV
ncbi:MAG: SUMF1/EgtB/PvdO family nonheme iron enzyme [Anaerolineae bacterium]|nr:SUMF1/EgtB/PvdO family nonheme iron enzyme [Anaerolineae bacterium]